MFPARVRNSAIGLATTSRLCIFGGTAPLAGHLARQALPERLRAGRLPHVPRRPLNLIAACACRRCGSAGRSARATADCSFIARPGWHLGLDGAGDGGAGKELGSERVPVALRLARTSRCLSPGVSAANAGRPRRPRPMDSRDATPNGSTSSTCRSRIGATHVLRDLSFAVPAGGTPRSWDRTARGRRRCSARWWAPSPTRASCAGRPGPASAMCRRNSTWSAIAGARRGFPARPHCVFRGRVDEIGRTLELVGLAQRSRSSPWARSRAGSSTSCWSPSRSSARRPRSC